MSGRKKCTFYNVGYCKYSRKENGCKLYHPEKCCQLLNCFDRECPRRHPRTCRFGETCLFQSGCAYKHSFGVKNKEIVDMTDLVEILKAEIVELKKENDCKINILAKVHYKELEYIQNENVLLRKALKDKDEYMNVTLAIKNSDLKNKWEQIKLMEENAIKEIKIRCVICEQLFHTKSGVRKHTNKEHGGNSYKEQPIQMENPNIVREENNLLQESLGNAEEIENELPGDQEDKEVEAPKSFNNKCYACNMCEKDFNSEKSLKGHIIFKHTSSAKKSS